MARELRSVSYFLQYVNIETQIQGFSFWQNQFMRYRDKRDFDACTQLVSLARSMKLDQESVEQLRLHQAELLLLRDDNEQAEKAFSHIGALSTSPSVRAMSLYRAADIQRISGRFESALTNYQNALEISNEIQDTATIPYLLHMMGVIHWAQENLDEAIRFYEMSLRAYRDLHAGWSDNSLRPGHIVINRDDIQRHIANVLRDLGDAHRRAGRTDIASRYFLESLAIQEKLGAIFEMALTYLSLGKLNREKQDYSVAIGYYKKALGIARDAQSPQFETESLFRVSEACYLLQDYQGAISWAEKAVSSASVHGFHNMKARALLSWSISECMLGNFSASVDLVLAALFEASQFGSNLLRNIVSEIETNLLPQVRKNNEEIAEILHVKVNEYKGLIISAKQNQL